MRQGAGQNQEVLDRTLRRGDSQKVCRECTGRHAGVSGEERTCREVPLAGGMEGKLRVVEILLRKLVLAGGE